MSEKEQDWGPTMTGNTSAYEPEYRQRYFLDGEERFTKWARVPTVDTADQGVPPPLALGGVFRTIGLFGYEQAHALAWHAAAFAAAQGDRVEVRVVAYELHYEIKAKRLDISHDGGKP